MTLIASAQILNTHQGPYLYSFLLSWPLLPGYRSGILLRVIDLCSGLSDQSNSLG